MSSAIRLDYREPPQQWLQYLRALRRKTNTQPQPELPPLNAFLVNQQARRRDVIRYARICGFDQHSPYLPISYPHLMAFSLHMELMLHHQFPLNVMGLVHIRNRIQQHRPIRIEEPLDVHCYLSDCVETPRGIEFSIQTDISRAGDIIWQESSVMLARKAKPQTHTATIDKTALTPALPSYRHTERWTLGRDLGRRYASISGDSNPIHLFALSAKLFGFKRHIAHGMWSMARVAAALSNHTNSGTLDIAFKQPIFLPNQVDLHYQINEQQITEFDIRAIDNQRVHARGTLTPY